MANFLLFYRRFSTFNAAKELPFDLESAVLLWLNKINFANTTLQMKQQIQQQQHQQQNLNNERIRVRKDQLTEKKVFPRVNSLKDVLCDGKTLLSIIVFYFNSAVNIEGSFVFICQELI